MDEDVAMDDDASPANQEDELKEYNLESYDEDDSMPGMHPFAVLFAS